MMNMDKAFPSAYKTPRIERRPPDFVRKDLQ